MQQACSLCVVRGLAWRQDKPQRVAQTIDRGVDFGGQIAFRTAKRFRLLRPLLRPHCAGGRERWWNQSSRIRSLGCPIAHGTPVPTHRLWTTDCIAGTPCARRRNALGAHASVRRSGQSRAPHPQICGYPRPSARDHLPYPAPTLESASSAHLAAPVSASSLRWALNHATPMPGLELNVNSP